MNPTTFEIAWSWVLQNAGISFTDSLLVLIYENKIFNGEFNVEITTSSNLASLHSC